MKEHVHSVFDVRVKKSVTGKIRKLEFYVFVWAISAEKSAGVVRTNTKTSLVAIAQ